MPWKATIAGVDVTNHIQTAQPVQITQLLNERATAQFRCKPGVSPNRFDPVVLYADDGVTPLFAGLVTNRTIVGIQTKDRKEPYSTDVQCGDYFTYLDWAYLNLTYTTAVTVKQILTDIIAALPSSTGVTLNPAQVPGPPVDPFAWTQMRASDAIRDLSQRTGYVATMSPGKVLTMFAPGATAAPFTITDAAPHCQTIVWTDNSYVPANDAIAVCGPSAQLVSTQLWTVGTPSTWQVDIQCVVGGWNAGSVTENPGPSQIVRTLSAPGGGGYYTFAPTTGLGTIALGTGVKAPAGTILQFVYTALFPFTVHATTGATPVIQFQQAYPNVVDYSQGLEKAQGLLAQLNQQPRDLTVTSLDTGWAPGQALTVNLTARLNSAFVITSVTLTLMARKGPTTHWVASVLATESNTYQGSYLDQWRALTGTSSPSSGVASTPPVGGGGTTGGGTGGITGVGTAGKVPKWASSTSLTDSVMTEASGFIGVGTTAPQTALHVASASVNYPIIGVSRIGSNVIGLGVRTGITNGTPTVQGFNASFVGCDMALQPEGGNVGIGTATPRVSLDVVSTTANYPFLAQGHLGTNLIGIGTRTGIAGATPTVQGFNASFVGCDLTLQPEGGNVGIGTPTPNIGGFPAGAPVLTIRGALAASAGLSGHLELGSFDVLSSGGAALGSLNFYNAATRIARLLSATGPTAAGGALQFQLLPATGSLAGVLQLQANTPTDFYLLPGTGTFQGNIGMLLQKWLTLYAAELHVETLVAQQTITTLGGRALIASGADILASQSNATDTVMAFKYNGLKNGDIILFEGPDTSGAYSVEFIQVTSAPVGSGPYTYTVTRNLDGSGANNWPAGATAMNTGQAGAGFIDMYAINGLRGPSENGPTLVGNIRNSATYNDWSPRWALGNLTGLPYGINQVGAAFGVPGRTRVTIDPVGGVLMYDGTNTVRVQISPSGGAVFTGDGSGVTSISGGNIQTGTITATQITARSITADRMAFHTLTAAEIAAGTITATEIAANTITAAKLNVSQLSAIAADLGSITAGAINAVTISGSTITGTTINGSTIHAGSGNEVTLDGSGITVAGGTGANNRYKFTSGSYVQGQQPGSADLVLYGAQNLVMSTGNGLGLALGSGALYPYNSGPVSLGTGGSPWVDVFATGTVTANALHQTTWPAGSNLAVHVLANGFLVANPSSLRYKEQIRPWGATLHHARAILSAQPILFDYLGPPVGSGQKDLLGFSAENLYDIDPHLVVLDADGRPEALRTDAILAHLLVALQDIDRRLTAVEGHA